MLELSADRRARLAVWGVWLAMLGVALICLATRARDLPLAEDWELVRVLTRHEPERLQWLWSQNGEHRIPLPRAVLVGLLWLARGDFRAGMVFDIAAVFAVAAAMIAVAQGAALEL